MRKNKTTKYLVMMLAIVITIAMMPTMAFAGTTAPTTGECGTNLTWAYDTGTLTIKGTGTTMTNYTNVALPPWNAHKDKIKSVVISASQLTNIGNYAFYQCTGLTTVTLPDSVEIIGESAFDGNISLANISLSKVKDIGAAAFRHTSLGSADMPAVATIGVATFDNCKLLLTVNMENAETIESNAFYECTSLKTVNMPKVKKIADNAFYECKALTTLDLSMVTTIEGSAFANCTGLTNFGHLKVATTINGNPFSGVTNLKDFTSIMEGNTSFIVDNKVLYNSDKTKLIAYPAGKEDRSFNVPDSVTTIEGYAFNGCSSLTTVTMPNVETINGCAFLKCSGLTTVTMPKVVTTEVFAFGDCKSLKTAIMPKANIGMYAFNNCTSLETVIAPVCQNIDDNAFKDCTSLQAAVIKNGCTVGTNVFAGVPSTFKLYVLTAHGDSMSVTGGISLEQESAGSNKYKNTTDGVTFDTSTNKLILHSGNCGAADTPESLNWILDTEGTLTISGTGAMEDYNDDMLVPWYAYMNSIKKVVTSATNIGSYAFYQCSALESVTMPNVVTIGLFAFNSCKALTSIDLSNVTEIQTRAFLGCTNLSTIENLNAATRIWGNPFAGCTKIMEFPVIAGTNTVYKTVDGVLYTKDGTELMAYPTGKTAETYNIGDEVTAINNSAFYGCSALTSINIIGNVEKILNYTFKDCTSLTNVDLSKVKKISSRAFENCINLSSIGSLNAATIIEANPFAGCTKLTEFPVIVETNLKYKTIEGVLYNKEGSELIAYPVGRNVDSYTVTKECKKIKAQAFKNCPYLKTLIAPTITDILMSAFEGCTSLQAAVIKNGCTVGTNAFAGVPTTFKLYVLTEKAGDTISVDGALKPIQAIRVADTSTIYKTADGTTFDTATNQLTPPSTGGGGGYFPPTPTPDPTAPIQSKEHTITNADGTKTTVILFDGTKSGTPAKGEALLSAEALAKIAAVKGAGAVVATSTSIVQFDQKALQAITGGQTKGNIKVIAEIVSKDTLTPEQKALLGDNALIIDLSVENENGKVTDFNGGTATVVINIPAGVDPTTLGAVYIKTNGKLEKVEGKVVMVNGVATFQFVTNHFSKFAVLDKATIAKAIATQDATAKDKLVKGVKATKLTAIKAVAKKSNVTVTWKKSKGYKVDGYQIWKSSKKTTGYKMMAKRTGQKYKNTYGLKDGKTYYYKVRGFREIDGKIVYTKWAQAKVVAK